MRIKKGDTVLIIKGKDKGKRGKVSKVLPKEKKIVVEGINLRKKHIRPKKTEEKGEILSVSSPLYISNTKLICPECKKATRTGYNIVLKKDKKIKVRICKKCGKEIK